jgi:phosphate transport system permease protein
MATATVDGLGAPRLTGTRRWGDRAFRAVTLASGLAVLVVLGLIAWTTTHDAWPALRHEGIGFVTKDDWVPNNLHFGALALIYGTLITALIAVIFAVPVSLGIALFITELAPPRIGRAATTIVDLLAAIPSVVFGLWAAFALAQPIQKHVYEPISSAFGDWPVLGRLFGGSPQGRSLMTAGLILAIMITPIVTSLSRDALATVPQSDRAGALAIGATRWESLRVSVFPRVRGGIVGAVMLGLGRAMGETIAVALILGPIPQITSHVFQPGSTLAAVIALNFGEASADPLQRGALIACGVVLFLITLAINGAARYMLRVSERRLAA